ncbi:chemotaxis protein [Streptomyces sp. NPDC096079]|uniref:ALF repeat-containing protein n=1 Tax=Streptomyces sp. NPDC096079 TaxID=3155820 RepID=UPI00331C062F
MSPRTQERQSPGIGMRALRTSTLGLSFMALTLGLLGTAPRSTDHDQGGEVQFAALSDVTTTDRGRVVEYWQAGGFLVRPAAEAALAGSDSDVQAFLASAGELVAQERRARTAQLASVGGTELIAAARAAFPDPLAVEDFLDDGWEAPAQQDRRIEVAQIISTGRPVVQETGRAALNGTSEDVSTFLRTGHQLAEAQDDRVQIAQIISVGGSNVKAAGRLAFNGTAADRREFLEVGQFVARNKDEERATVAELAAQAKEAGRQAARETETAKALSKEAADSSVEAKKAALTAQAEAEAAKGETEKAAGAAKRAASAASLAAKAAQKAISAANAANNSARIAANAAAQAAAASAAASQAAARAQAAAADAAVDASNAASARTAAEEARAIAKNANLAADAADQASKAATAAGDAAASAASAGVNATIAANAAIEASTHAGSSSAAAAEARAAAAATQRHADEANRAAAAAEDLSRDAATAAGQARDAARSAATHANNAAAAAEDAADHAGDAATAATKATAHANAATQSANTATSAVLQAQKIFELARKVEAEELLGRTNAGIELARDQKAADIARTAKATEVETAGKNREAERDRLVAILSEPGADIPSVSTQGRKLAVQVMKEGTAWGRAAAEAALTGPDEVVVDYLKNGWATVREQDDRSYVERLAEESETPEIRAAAETALSGSAADVATFVSDGQYQVASQAMRLAISQVISQGGPVVTDEGRAALNSGAPKRYSEFLTKGQFNARTQDERVRVVQLISAGTPEVRSAAKVAFEGSPQVLHAFIASGQYMAARKDHLSATHVAQVRKLIADAAVIAAGAQRNAALAQKVAADARKAATEANNWSLKAQDAAADAKTHAAEADQYAKDAEASAASAAVSAATARDAANAATADAKNAALSASDATLSSEMAQVSATLAWTSAEQARQSYLAAGEDAGAALEAAKETFTITVKKYREEETARRKAALEKKQKAMQDPGYVARQQYRCGQAIVPCDPQQFTRWCQHNWVSCELYSYTDELGEALTTGGNFLLETTGFGNLESCLDNKDFESCWELGADVLLGSKFRALDKALDRLQLLQRGCKLIGATTSMVPSSAAISVFRNTASGATGCLEGLKDHDVIDPETGKIITDIDFFEGNTLWEDKHVLGGWDDEVWIKKQIEGKVEKYLKARQHLPEFYRDAEIGFRFTRPNQDPRFVELVEDRFRQLREKYPTVTFKTKWF